MHFVFGPGYGFLKNDFLKAPFLKPAEKIVYRFTPFCRGEEKFVFKNKERFFYKPICVVLSTIFPRDWMRLFMLLHEVRTHLKPSWLGACLPYMGYGRQNQDFLISLLLATGVQGLATCNPHHDLPFPQVQTVEFSAIWQSVLATHVLPGDVLVCPDQGSLRRLGALAQDLQCTQAWIEKGRDEKKVYMASFHGDVLDRTCWIVDDLIDTGKTLEMAVTCVKQYGARRVNAVITHTLFSPLLLRRLGTLPLDGFFTARTVPWPFTKLPFPVSHFSIADLFRPFLASQTESFF